MSMKIDIVVDVLAMSDGLIPFSQCENIGKTLKNMRDIDARRTKRCFRKIKRRAARLTRYELLGPVTNKDVKKFYLTKAKKLINVLQKTSV